MSTAELVYEKTRALPGERQAETLRFVNFLLARSSAASEAEAWRQLLRETQRLAGLANVSDADIEREVAAVRAKA